MVRSGLLTSSPRRRVSSKQVGGQVLPFRGFGPVTVRPCEPAGASGLRGATEGFTHGARLKQFCFEQRLQTAVLSSLNLGSGSVFFDSSLRWTNLVQSGQLHAKVFLRFQAGFADLTPPGLHVPRGPPWLEVGSVCSVIPVTLTGPRVSAYSALRSQPGPAGTLRLQPLSWRIALALCTSHQWPEAGDQ